MKTRNILMLCLGNICRSPLAQGLMEKKASAKGLDWFIDSAGIGHWHIGKHPDKRSIKVAQENDLDITGQRARRFEVNDFEAFDNIYAMDIKNYETLMLLARTEEEKEKVTLIMDELHPKERLSVPDPFHDGEENFLAVYETLDKLTDAILANSF